MYTINNLPNLFDVHAYVNPETREVEALYAYTFLGIFDRVDKDWLPVNRDETRLNEFADHMDYQIDWDKDPMDVADLDGDDPDSWPQGAVIDAYDNGALTLDILKKYCTLENGKEPEATGK
jgi:hypothetical protein